jgi:predicted lipid-binding transport protein (Tim44 family)
MATRKQRARRAKTFRHEYGFVQVDEEGNEIELSGSDVRGTKDTPTRSSSKTGAKAGKAATGRGARTARDPQPPTWNRAIKKGLLMGLGAGLVATLLIHGPIALAAVYAVLFIPLTYWTDSFTYKRFERTRAAGTSPRSGKTR